MFRSILPMLAAALTAFPQSTQPRFEDYPATEVFTGKPAVPIIDTPGKREYRTRIRNGVSTGSDVWIGPWRDHKIAPGPNFAGHYFAIRWGCGSQCMMMAIVDAKTGVVYRPPLAGPGTDLWVPIDNLSDQELDLRPDSTLMVLRDACTNFKNRDSCGTYFLNLQDSRFTLVKFIRGKPLSER